MGNLLGNVQFELEHKGQKVKVSEHTVHEQQVYRLVFDNNIAPLVLTRLSTWEGKKWTSIPQGRQKEAEEFGVLIAQHLERR
ncbi:MAG TPA: hypothetical protein VN040_14860 [Pseudosphingobacterium sp.]|nr:hypothetical protein [Pseudosphingobacterium sp.]